MTIRSYLLRKLIDRKDRKDRKLFFSVLPAAYASYYRNLANDKPLNPAFVATRSIFIHVPKCAGRSIANALYGIKGGGHYPVIWYQGRFPEEYEQYFTYTIVRNPWDRLVSAWLSVRQADISPKTDARYRSLKVSIDHFGGFEEFVMNWVSAENVARLPLFAPACSYILDINGFLTLDYVGRFEDIRGCYEEISKRIGKDAKLEHKQRYRTEREHYRSYYSDRMIERVADVYRQDVDLLGYNFE